MRATNAQLRVRTAQAEVRQHEQDVARLRAGLEVRIERLSDQLMKRLARVSREDAAAQSLQAEVRLLGQLLAALDVLEPGSLPEQGAGFGSTVEVLDLLTNERRSYTLMVGSLMDIDAGHVSLASPVGQALLGRGIGSNVAVALPHRVLKLRIVGLTTIDDRIEEPLRSA